VHYYSYNKNKKNNEWFGFLNGIVIKMETAQLTPLFAEKAMVVVLTKIP
jgi:hypothetical protein